MLWILSESSKSGRTAVLVRSGLLGWEIWHPTELLKVVEGLEGRQRYLIDGARLA